MSFKVLFVGQINPYLSSDAQLTAGTLVKLDTANPDKVVVAGAGDAVVGFAAQDVIAANVDNYKLDSVTHKARVGDKIGVHFGGGLYKTTNYSGNVTRGANLYAGAGGKLVLTVSGSAVAVAETAGNSANGDEIRIKSLV